ncbi:hypothetical protein QN277_028964 [Acacia crassicarpa]|uniref:CCHC-type domain-containing protein n=1 Tax=Acacia crassicarpa TaxID=499986 RepID=A0AAE1J4C4_9FABA|nr:hypothetical protein QN277_028964 [Acacia crassicarpa]
MEEVQISSPLIWNEVETKNILIGKILVNKVYSRVAMESILCKAWNLQSGFEVTEITGNAFLFKFKCEEDYIRILRGRPWSINGTLLNLQERSKYKAYEEFDFSCCPIWIQIHNVPLEALCLANAVTIGGHVEEVLLVEDPFYHGRYLRNFLRARIMIDLQKPLAYGFWMPRPDGRKTWITIKYEKLQTFCYKCGKIGHDNCICQSEKLMSCYKPEEPRYGAWLSTTVCRSWDETLVVLSTNEAEAMYVKRKKEEDEKKSKDEGSTKTRGEGLIREDDLFHIRISSPMPGTQRRGINEIRKVKETTVEETLEAEVTKAPSSSNKPTVQRVGTEAHHGSSGMDTIGDIKSPEGSGAVKRYVKLDSPYEEDSGLMACTSMAVESEVANSMALVVYNGCTMNEVLKGINNLGLKREAAKEWESGEPKRRKCEEKSSSPLNDISNYANSLKKIKARIRRSGRKRGAERKENTPMEGEMQDKEIEGIEGYEFVFRARSGKRKEVSANGVGGWPEASTKVP